jgi:hypothetical protein
MYLESTLQSIKTWGRGGHFEKGYSSYIIQAFSFFKMPHAMLLTLERYPSHTHHLSLNFGKVLYSGPAVGEISRSGFFFFSFFQIYEVGGLAILQRTTLPSLAIYQRAK